MYTIILWLSYIFLAFNVKAQEALVGEKALEESQVSNKKQVDAGSPAKLIDSPKCSEDLKRLCGNDVHNLNNFNVLDCVQNQERDDRALLNEECHHILWSYKYDLTQSTHIEELAKGYCKEDLNTFNECAASIDAYSNTISCMIQNINKITEEKCRQYIIRLGSIIFSDYHLIQPMTTSCRVDIDKHLCGRVQSTASREPHSQGLTIECLSKHMDKLEHDCRVQILKLAELQSEDFHLDRAFYFACRNERDKFCRNVRAGKGQVYKCLIQHKNERTMSEECVEQLTRRQNMIAYDYQVSRGLVKACRNAIKENQCRKGVGKDDQEIKLSKILLCLEGALRKGKIVEGECQEEIIAHRQMMLEISPKIVENCKPELEELCSEARGPSKMHCLLKQFKKRNKHRISAECQRALEEIIKVADPAEDWRVDPILYEACFPVVQSRCHGLKGGQGRVMRCLMRQINSQHMTANCESALLEIQYFVARDWKLDPQLYKTCRNDSIKFCHAQHDWTEINSSDQGADSSFLVLPCLFRYAYHPSPKLRLSDTCAEDVRRVMHERAAFVQLHPQIEMECLGSLATICAENTAPGEEMMCLQKNMDRLEGRCLTLIKNYTEAEAKDIGLNHLVMTYCAGVMEQVCADVMQTEGIDEGAVMDCLIQNKNLPQMREHFKCRAVVENFQIIMIKDVAFTPKFKHDCEASVRQHCQAAQNRKEVLDCLSQRILYDILNEDRSSVTKPCRQQVRKQLTQRHENINLDPELKQKCDADITRNCQDVNGPGMILECLRAHKSSLTLDCHAVLFQREKEENIVPTTDVLLMRSCREMLKTFCRESEPTEIVSCLIQEKDNPDFDIKCRNVLMSRMVEKTKDITLNADLYRVCRADAIAYCSSVMNIKTLVERNGKVIECLKEILPQKKLSLKCEMKIIQLTKLSALNARMDPILMDKCKSDIKVLCPMVQLEGSEKGEIEECLKLQLEHDKILEEDCKIHVAEIMQRERADIHADPLLYKVCTIDDAKFCEDKERGTHLACLFDILDRNPTSLQSECRKKLRERREMFKAAVKVSKLENVEDLVEGVRSSPNRNYLLVILFSVVGFVFLGGLTCGRATRRSYKLMKNR